jgi:ribosomal-protein-alanine N-acetyltransferase
MTWQLRRAMAADLEPIMAIESSVFANDAWSAAVMKAELHDKHGFYVVAVTTRQPETISAYAGLRAPRGEPQADIQTIAVTPSARRHGLGRVLMTHLISEARDRGAKEIFLEVRADNPSAQALYDSLAFETLAIRPNYYQPDGVDALVMRHIITAPEVTVA